MAFYLSPLVDVNEIDLSTTIPAVATSIGVIVLRDTYKGPEMKQTLITSENELVRMFGKPIKRAYDGDGSSFIINTCYRDWFSAVGYLKYGNKLYCTRTMGLSATFAGIGLDSETTPAWTGFDTDFLTLQTETMTGDITDPDDFGEDGTVTTMMGTDPMWFIAKSRGNWGNSTRITLVDRTTQTQMLSAAVDDTITTSNVDVYNAVMGIDSKLTTRLLDNGAVVDDNFLVIVQSKAQGSSAYSTVEVHNVSLWEDYVDDGGQNKFFESINDNSDYIRVNMLDGYKNTSDDVTPADFDNDWVSLVFNDLTGGADRSSQGDNVPVGVIQEGYELYQNAEEIDVNIFIDSDKDEEVKRKIIEICESRLDAMGTFDVPYDTVVKNKGAETIDIRNWRNGLSDPGFNQNSSYAALYGNWLNVYDKYLQEYHWVPASGYMAGLFARTDEMRDAWWAPAGLNRAIITGVRKLAWNPTLGNRDILYMNGINPIVSFAGQGKVVWGQKTMLDKSSSFDRINVRRLFMVLEKAISTASKYFLFEQNDRFTWAQMKGMIEPFLRDVQSRRGIYDFRVIIDETNNTGERIDRNEMWCDLYIKPTRSAEFIVLNFISTKTGVDFSEVIGQV